MTLECSFENNAQNGFIRGFGHFHDFAARHYPSQLMLLAFTTGQLPFEVIFKGTHVGSTGQSNE